MKIISTTQIEEEKEYLICGIICKGSRVLAMKLNVVNHLLNEREILLLN